MKDFIIGFVISIPVIAVFWFVRMRVKYYRDYIKRNR